MFGSKKGKSVGENVVLLHQLERGAFTPSISPFALKLETYLRMTKIPYQNDFENPTGPKGKTPWITFNGEDIADSQICIDRLSQHFKIDLSSHLTEEERGIARSFQIMVDEHLFWAGALWQIVYAKGKDLQEIHPSSPWFLRYVMPLLIRKMRNQASAQGIGLHSPEEVNEMAIKDLRAISGFLGTKQFLMGDKPTEVDCAVFGMLAQIVWNMPDSPYETHVNGELSNLKSYCQRIKEELWPDWDKCLYKSVKSSD